MDLATLIGLIGSLGIVIAAMVLGGDPGVFFNIPSLLIVIGGMLLVVLMKFTVGQFLGVGKIAAKAFLYKSISPEDIITETVELADAARKGGLLSLEDKEVSSDFMQRGIQLLVDGHDPDIVKTLLNKEMKLTNDRHQTGISVFSSMGDVAPSMGMIGTLVGLVQMLSNMSDPKSIGPAMAVALLTTLYGAMVATMVALPIADKLAIRKDEEALNQALIIDGLLAIQAGQNPRVIEQMLRNYLPESKRAAAAEQG
ncbi:flagellar motor protein PomA [Amphritea sp. 2_MG-2023]|uniref:flagellar motor protein PomA n=1 Tax=Amphritea TaxID=515417 RepID=UPI001C07DA91|nr:flagellar motor protein PomA [Amphritea sp. 2_MG-2023]MBU2965752.1 flagellar motor protein PomA [Amphritea atlantica]MDO6417308.1 flagellar motor protein PomA [Amphritea sp. 2_MG-2023]MDX2423134.1 flagellar motor protein PomA [Amphritea sp.]